MSCALVESISQCYPRIMITTPTRFRQRDLKRALKAVKDAELVVERVEIDPLSGKVSIVMGADTNGVHPTSELDEWLASHARAS
jgi:MinD superfamily P-loop ATPase